MNTTIKVGDKVRIVPQSTHLDEIKQFYDKDHVVERIEEESDETLFFIKNIPGVALRKDIIKI